MKPNAHEMFPLESTRPEEPRELNDEAALVSCLAVDPLDPAMARAFARRKYWLYFFIAAFGLGLPLAVFGASTLGDLGVPRRIVQGMIVLILLGFFGFFYAMLGLLLTRNRILPLLGLRAVAGEPGEAAGDASAIAERKGRRLEYGVNPDGNFWRSRAPSSVFAIEYRSGGFYAGGDLPTGLRKVFDGLPPHRRWRGLKIVGGPQGIQTARPARLAKYFLHDLWLLERILDSLEER